jgi:PHP family Zn ribbon phosphoesterase
MSNPSTDKLIDFSADLHIHTVLSPCADLEMSPVNIIREAQRKGLDIIAITDHNASAHCKVTGELGKEAGIFVLYGMEITTSEETHCLTYFENLQKLNKFQEIIDASILKIKNKPKRFGYQVIVDKEENILGEIDWLLLNAVKLNLDQLAEKAHELGGIVIPAHIDRSMFSLTSQLGFVPPDLQADAYEVSKYSTPAEMILKYPYLNNKTFIRTSDSHYLKDIGSVSTVFRIKNRSFEEIKMAISNTCERMVIINR